MPINELTMRIFSYMKKEKNIISNFINLCSIQLVNLLFPILVYPFLIHNYGLEKFGNITFHQGIVAFFAIIINYGFYITGAKYIANSKKCEHSLIVSNILTVKVILWFLSLLLIYCISLLNFKFIDRDLLFLCFLATFYELLFVQWFFQGVEDLKWINIVNTVSKISLALLCFSFINPTSSIYILPSIYVIINLLSGLISIFIMHKRYNIKYNKCSIKQLKTYFLDAGPIFFSNLVISIKDRSSTLLIGSLLGMSFVTIYDLGLRLLNLASIPTSIFCDSIFPRAVKTKSKLLLIKSISLVFISSTFILLISFYLLEPFILFFLGEQAQGNIIFLNVILISLPVIGVSLVIARLGLIVFGLNKQYFNSMLFSVAFYIAFIIFGLQLSLLSNLWFYISAMLLTYLAELFFRLYFAAKFNLFEIK